MARPCKGNPKGEQKSPKKTKETINKLLEGFRNDFTITEACAFAGISMVTYYERIKKDKQLSNDIDSAKERCFIMAKDAVRKGLVDGDKEFALKWLKNRQNKIYSERNDTEPTQVNVNLNWGELSTEELEKIISGK